MDILIYLAVLAVVAGIVVWCISLLPLPAPYGRIVQVVVALIFVLLVLRAVLPLTGVRY